ncbi:sugar phosphate nucleotidyltransferase [Aureispira anguillae]|uniref:Sugar phosphate nucleotidyltransferase n=1 Tax=Aureispira anguillae TaxID=2864201 RepID=A0A915YKJ9_9BACT|nr:sugar phosphate nucleotidyltransferase [Aureispira anguillae]BDS14790.1 sugar phosphate nucleotidyltransferase [Aureispira anguillae]
MKIIIPMAGRGTRLRPHTLTVPKPLVEVAGKSIVKRLVEDLAAAYDGKIEEVAFIIGDFGEAVEQDLIALAESLGAKGSIYHQTEKLGTAHAILCAKESLSGNVIVAFADTLFKSDFSLDTTQDSVLWVQQIEDPSAYGVVTLDQEGYISEFVEKPTTFVSDLAIIGIYYFRDANMLKNELQYLIDNDVRDKGEYQITNALENMRRKGVKFRTHAIQEWLDCGNKNAVVYANERILEIKQDAATVSPNVVLENSTIIPPCFIDQGVIIQNSVIGPHVSISKNTVVKNSIISKSIIQDHAVINNIVTENSMLGSHTEYIAQKSELSLSDFSKFHQ